MTTLSLINELIGTAKNVYPMISTFADTLLTDTQKKYLITQFREHILELTLAGISFGTGLYLLLNDNSIDQLFKGNFDDMDKVILLIIYVILVLVGASILAYRLYLIFANMPK